MPTGQPALRPALARSARLLRTLPQPVLVAPRTGQRRVLSSSPPRQHIRPITSGLVASASKQSRLWEGLLPQRRRDRPGPSLAISQCGQSSDPAQQRTQQQGCRLVSERITALLAPPLVLGREPGLSVHKRTTAVEVQMEMVAE